MLTSQNYQTQRAVSYYEIPSQTKDPKYLDKIKDTVPAGKVSRILGILFVEPHGMLTPKCTQGMKNVQLLVVNREDRNKICNVGEVGEIYVRFFAALLPISYGSQAARHVLKVT